MFAYDLGLESAKLISAVLSMNQSLTDVRNFLFGDKHVNSNKLIYPIKLMLPQTAASITGSMWIQSSVGKSFGSNAYYSATGSYSNINTIWTKDEIQYNKFSPSFSGSEYVLYDQYNYGMLSKIQRYDYGMAFALNTSIYNDGVNIVFTSKKNNGDYTNDFIGFSSDSYNVNFGQTSFGKRIAISTNNIIRANANNYTQFIDSFSDMVQNCSNFADLSYSNAYVRNNFGDLSPGVISAFRYLASVDLNV